jgi:hypothetical protein
MEYIGNYVDYINEEWINYIETYDGYPRPSGGRNPDSEEFRQAGKKGYDLSSTYWYIYEGKEFPYKVKPPFSVSGDFLFWFIKMKPSNIMPMHVDPHSMHLTNVSRYWMSLKDYEPGHVFIYENELAVDYRKGDIFKYNNPQALHGAANIGWSDRLIMCFSVYSEE